MLRNMVKAFAEAVMPAEADAVCGAAYGTVSEGRVNYRNGYRGRPWDTQVGTIDLAVPRLREGSCFPQWLLRYRRRAEAATVSVVATSYLLGDFDVEDLKVISHRGTVRAVDGYQAVAPLVGWARRRGLVPDASPS